jgi:hypothetical protein
LLLLLLLQPRLSSSRLEQAGRERFGGLLLRERRGGLEWSSGARWVAAATLVVPQRRSSVAAGLDDEVDALNEGASHFRLGRNIYTSAYTHQRWYTNSRLPFCLNPILNGFDTHLQVCRVEQRIMTKPLPLSQRLSPRESPPTRLLVQRAGDSHLCRGSAIARSQDQLVAREANIRRTLRRPATMRAAEGTRI